MGDRSAGHVGLCLVIVACAVYVLASYGYAVWAGSPAGSVLSQPWLAALVVLVTLTGVFGIAAGTGLWIRAPTGRRLGFAFVAAWALTEALAIWGWLEGPSLARPIVRDPMAPPFRLWFALSIGLYLWGWAGGYVEPTEPAGAES